MVKLLLKKYKYPPEDYDTAISTVISQCEMWTDGLCHHGVGVVDRQPFHVRTLVQKMADAFPGGVLVFDAANRTAVKMIAKTWLKSAKIKDVGAYFAVSDAKSELSLWDSRLQVTSRGYMLGYNDLRDPSVSGFFRFLAKVGDGMMKMQIVKIGFGGRKW